MFKRSTFLVLFLLVGCGGPTTAPETTAPATPKFNGGEVGNGGHGILIDGKIALYDLWEAGLVNERRSLEWKPAAILPQIVGFFGERLSSTLPAADFPLHELSWKLGEVYAVDPVAALAVAEAIQAYRWSMVDKLRDLPLKDRVVTEGGREVVLIANRTGRFIHVSREVWARMESLQKMALIFHEAIFSLAPPQRVQLADGTVNFQQNAKRVRELTAIFFGGADYTDLLRRGLYDFVDPSEIPLTSRKLGEKERASVTSTFFSKFSPHFTTGLDASTLSVFGPAEMRVRIDDKSASLAFPLSFSPAEMESRIEGLCKTMVDKESGNFTISLAFGDTSAYEMKFSQYIDRGEMKPFLQHTPTAKKEVLLYLDGALRLASALLTLKIESLKTGKPMIKSPEKVKELTELCQDELRVHLEKVRTFLYPQRWKITP